MEHFKWTTFNEPENILRIRYSPIDDGQGEIFPDQERHRKLVGKFTIKRPNISFAIRVLHEFIQCLHINH